MKYIGMHSQIRSNNTKSVLLLLGFPAILLGMVWLFLFVVVGAQSGGWNGDGTGYTSFSMDDVNEAFFIAAPFVVGIVLVWFLIAYKFNAAMVRAATGAKPLERKDNMRIYNMVENLTMTCGMDMPQVYVVNDPQLNAYASGIDKKSYAVTLTTGIIDCLNDQELEGVIAHELTHIRNRDTRLLITSIVFVGIVSTIMTIVIHLLKSLFWSGASLSSRRRNDKDNNILGYMIVLVIGLVCAAIAYFFTLLTRFAISRKREFMADAGGAELCGNPLALASALRKISGNPGLQNCDRDDIAQLFIAYPHALSGRSFLSNLFSTHPDINKRIEILEQF